MIPIYPIFSIAGELASDDLIPSLPMEQVLLREDIVLAGDAPKQIGHIIDSNGKVGSLFIIKTPQYRYPVEAIYEHLFARLGQLVGIVTAETKLLCINGQIRLLSKYFLAKGQQLMHGTEIYSSLIGSREEVLKIEKDKLSSVTFTVQKTIQALEKEGLNDVLSEFIKLLFFDALVGHTDRNLTNWGVIVTPNAAPTFAPTFDTVRGMMLNIPDERLQAIRENKRAQRQFWQSQLGSVLPKIGWDTTPNCSHIALIAEISNSSLRPEKDWLTHFFSPTTEAEVIQMLKSEFEPLLSEVRFWAIQTCLHQRWEAMRGCLTGCE